MSRTLRAAAMAATLLVAGGASAGAKIAYPVTIAINQNGVAMSAKGAMGTARNSANTKEYIGCTVQAKPASVRCWAVDANGKGASCTSTDPAIIQAALGVIAESNLFFTIAADATTCSGLWVSTFSYHEPKQP